MHVRKCVMTLADRVRSSEGAASQSSTRSGLTAVTVSFIYTIRSCSSASHLVPRTADIEMNEVNAVLANHCETHPGEKEHFVDNSDTKPKN